MTHDPDKIWQAVQEMAGAAPPPESEPKPSPGWYIQPGTPKTIEIKTTVTRLGSEPAEVRVVPASTLDPDAIAHQANQIANRPRGGGLRWAVVAEDAVEKLPATLGDCTTLQQAIDFANRYGIKIANPDAVLAALKAAIREGMIEEERSILAPPPRTVEECQTLEEVADVATQMGFGQSTRYIKCLVPPELDQAKKIVLTLHEQAERKRLNDLAVETLKTTGSGVIVVLTGKRLFLTDLLWKANRDPSLTINQNWWLNRLDDFGSEDRFRKAIGEMYQSPYRYTDHCFGFSGHAPNPLVFFRDRYGLDIEVME